MYMKSYDALHFSKEIYDLVAKSFLFKLEVKNVVSSRFDQSICVKKCVLILMSLTSINRCILQR